MKRISHKDEAAKNMVQRFCDQVLWLRNIRHIFRELFENETSEILIDRTAPSFFGDLNKILHRYVLLEFAKITDPAVTKRENFSVANLIASIDWPQGIRNKLAPLKDKAEEFRRYILDVRNKSLAHTDKKEHMANSSLGGFPEGEDEIFLETLQEICDITHEVCFCSIFGKMILAKPGDVINLKHALANSIAFDMLWSESSGQEIVKLDSYLQKARHRPSSTQGEAKKNDC